MPAITVSKLMGSEGCGGVGVQSDRVSVVVSHKMDPSRSFRDQNAAWKTMVNGETGKYANKVSSLHVEEASKDFNSGSPSNPFLLLPEREAKQHKRKSGKEAKSYNGFSKRPRVAQLEVCIDESVTDGINGKAMEVGPSPANCIVTEKTQTSKQRMNLHGKRGDKRNGKGPKGKCDSFSVKSGLVSFSSAAGVNNILGVYGSRPETEDITLYADELSLNELLDDSYKCPSFAKDKGKKSANPNANILHSVREVWSILQKREVKPQIDGGYYREVSPPCLPTSNSSVASRSGGDKEDTSLTDLSSGHKDSGNKLKTSASILDFPLYQPKDMLERLSLPPSKDLENLLLDASKPAAAASRNNTDLRLAKSSSHRGCLPPFSWSNNSSWHCKSNPDAVKLYTSKTTCQGRWVKAENPSTFLETTPCFLAELESLTYDCSLVPAECQTLVPVRHEKDLPKSVSFTEQGSSSTFPVDSQASPAGNSPRVLAAAQILCGMTSHSSKQNAYGVTKWEKRLSQKSVKARNFKPNEKSENIFAIPRSKVRPGNLMNDTLEEMIPSKKSMLSVKEKGADLVHDNNTGKGPLNWPMPRSSRSSPSKSLRDSVPETKHHAVKKSFMPRPAARRVDLVPNSQPKSRKLMRIGWNREGGKLE